jgi:hypothetical protein
MNSIKGGIIPVTLLLRLATVYVNQQLGTSYSSSDSINYALQY